MSKQSKWLIGLVVLLVVANLALVATIWLKKDKEARPRGDAKDYLVEQLSLSKDQITSFDNLRSDHFRRMKDYQEGMRHLKDSFFQQLNQPNAKPDSLARQMGEQQMKIDVETFDHFSKLRSLLNEEQKKKFDNIIQDVLRTMAPRGGLPPPGRPGEEGPPH